MSDLIEDIASVDQQVGWVNERLRSDGIEPDDATTSVLAAARRWSEFPADEDVEIAAYAILVDEAMHQKPGQEVVMKDRYRRQARAALESVKAREV